MARLTAKQRAQRQREIRAKRRTEQQKPRQVIGGGQGNSAARRRNRRSSSLTTIPASKRPADMRKGQVYGQDSKSTGRNWSKPYGQVSDKPSSGDPKTWKKAASKPKPSPKPKPTKKPTATKPTAPAKKKPTQPKNAGAGNGAPKPSSIKAKAPQIKSKRLRDALSNLKVRDYKKKK